MNVINYKKAELYNMDLNSLYEGSDYAYELLDKNLVSIVNTEAPIIDYSNEAFSIPQEVSNEQVPMIEPQAPESCCLPPGCQWHRSTQRSL